MLALLVTTSARTSAQSPSDANVQSRPEIEEITVTAAFREQSLQDVPSSLVAFDGSRIEDLGLSDIGDLTRFTPGLNNNDRGPGRNDMNIRGMGRLASVTDYLPTPSPVGFYLDDISVNTFSSSQADVGFWGVHRVEVLRGPQGTLYGESAEGGAVRFLSQDPNLESLEATVGVHGSRVDDGSFNPIGRLMLNVPVLDDAFGLRFFGEHSESTGFIDNVVDGEENINRHESNDARLIAFADVADLFTTRLAVHYKKMKLGANPIIDGDEDRLESKQDTSDDHQDDESLLVPLKLSTQWGWLRAESIAGYYRRDARRDVFSSAIAVFASLLTGPAGQLSDGHWIDDNRYRQWTHELRLISEHEGHLNFTAGMYFKHGDTHSTVVGTSRDLPGVIISQTGVNQVAKQLSGYGELEWRFNERWAVAGGLRSHSERLETDNDDTFLYGANAAGLLGGALPGVDLTTLPAFQNAQLDGTRIDGTSNTNVLEDLLPSARLEYSPIEDVLLYGRYATGIRNGNVNAEASVFVAQLAHPDADVSDYATYDSDFVQTVELGSKFSLFDDRLTLNGAIFHSDWTDLQVVILDPIALTVNAGGARVMGMELESNLALSDRWSLFGTGSLIDAEISESFVARPASAGSPEERVPKGTKIPYSQDYSFALGLNYERPVWLETLMAFRLNYAHTGPYAQFLQSSNIGRGDAGNYGIWNLAFDLSRGQWKFGVQIQNVLNRIEQVSNYPATKGYEDITGLPAPEGQSIDENYVNTPRRIQVGLTWYFGQG